MELIHLHAPSLQKLLTGVAKKEVEVKDGTTVSVTCCKQWRDLLQALSSTSPVCALVPPTEEVHAILKEMQSSSLIKADIRKMAVLQKEIPVLFKLIEDLTHYPSAALQPVLGRLMELSLAPFAQKLPELSDLVTDDNCTNNGLSYFPKLPMVRMRKLYTADGSKPSICVKKSSRHPTLLPGIFTIYCQHGE